MIRTTLILGCACLTLAGCNTWSTSNVKANPPETVAAPVTPATVTVTEGDITNRSYTKLSDLKVSVNKTTAFHPSPTREAVIAKLKEEAASIGADAVVNAEISDVQIGALSWGMRVGTGEAVKFDN